MGTTFNTPLHIVGIFDVILSSLSVDKSRLDMTTGRFFSFFYDTVLYDIS